MTSAKSLLHELRQARAVFGAPAEAKKQQLLQALSRRRVSRWQQLVEYHEHLLFLMAFPGDRSTGEAAARELHRFARRWRAVPAASRGQAENSGIAGTVTRPALAWPIARAFADEAIDIDWPNLEDPAAFDALVAQLLTEAEREAFEGGDYTTRGWVRLSKRSGERDAAWLIRKGTAAAKPTEFATAWDAAQVPLRWNLAESQRSATHARLAVRRPVFRTAFRRPTEPATRHVARPLHEIRPLERREATQVIKLARSALAVRGREVHAMNYPNLAEVLLADLGEGIELALIGVPPSQRLTLEANYGYLLISNGVPIGYGGVSPLFRQANTGINVFDPFRGSEAAFVWLQTLRAFRTLFGVRRFIINGYQFGAGNSEAIASGAYWFYYRLGFRPDLAANRAVAADEAERLRIDPHRRTRPAVLKRLAQGDLHLDLADFNPKDFFEEPLLTRLGAAVARHIAVLPVRSQRDGGVALQRHAQLQLGVRSLAGWPTGEQRSFRRLAPYVSLLDLARWSSFERRALVQWMRDKGAVGERRAAVRATDQVRFFRELRAVARQEQQRADER